MQMMVQLHQLLQKARNYYLIAIVLALLASVTTYASAGQGGIIWTGGFIVAALLLWRAGRMYFFARGFGIRLRGGALALVLVSLPVTLLAAGGAGLSLLDAESGSVGASSSSSGSSSFHIPGPTEPGSCWHEEGGGQVGSVSCASNTADWYAYQEVEDPASCEEMYIGGRQGYYLCLRQSSTS